MNARNLHTVVTQIHRRGWVLAALLAVALICTGASFAQSNAGPAQAAKPAPAMSSAADTRAAESKEPLVAKSTETPGQSPARGTQEGIKVHGHWTIEVRNPDGSVDKHVEFENQICPDQTYTRPGTLVTEPATATFNGGAAFLAGLATGQASAGAWSIILASGNEAAAAPIPPGCVSPVDVLWVSNPDFQPPDVINIVQSNAWNPLANDCQNNKVPTEHCSATLTPPPSGPNISLSGLYLVPQTVSGTIALVSTANFWCNDGGATTPSACVTATANRLLVPAIVTGTQLPGTGVSYSGGQTIAVTVLISFQ